MARKSKIETEKPANGQGSEPGTGSTKSEPKATGAAAKPRQKKAAPKKKTVRKPAASKKAPPPARVPEPSDEQIRLRAYFIAERRLQLSLAGDSAHDWIEAKRQLIEEAGSDST